MSDLNCRISFTDEIKADENTYRIILNNLSVNLKIHKNTFYCYSSEEVFEVLYKIMEKYDTLDSYSIYCDNYKEIFELLIFLREQNPRKLLNVYEFNEQRVGVIFEGENSEENETFEIVDSINFIKNS